MVKAPKVINIKFWPGSSVCFSPSAAIGDSRYLTPACVIAKYGVGRQTLTRWHAKGKLRAVTTPGGKHLYHSGDVEKLFHSRDTDAVVAPEKEVLLYARVSSEHQRGDLTRQIDDLKRAFPNHAHLYQDVASGLNWKRPGLVALLDRVYKGGVDSVVVANRDRLARFGVELIEWIFRQADAKLVVLGQQDHSEGQDHHHDDPEHELADDLISIVTVFVAKHNGRRSANNRRRRKAEAAAAADDNALKEAQGEETSESVDSREAAAGEGQAHPDLPHHIRERKAAQVDRHSPLDIQRVPKGHSKRRRTHAEEGSSSEGTQ